MNWIYLLGGSGLLYFLYALVLGVRRDRVLAELRRKDRSEEIAQIAKATQEIANAKIRYDNARREYDALTSGSSSEGVSDRRDQN